MSIHFVDISESLREHLVNWYVSQGKNPKDRKVIASIEYACSGVPNRAQNLIDIISKYSEFENLNGTRILDVGCGLGTVAIYILIEEKPKYLVAMDISRSPLCFLKKRGG